MIAPVLYDFRVEYVQLAAKYKPAVNLGQGCPDFHAPEHVIKALAEAATADSPLLQQYTKRSGHPRLVQNLARLYSPLIGRELDSSNEILVTCGAYEALYSAIMGHVEQGDEVIVIEPFFDCYDFMITAAGGTPKFIPLKPKTTSGRITSADWVFDDLELAAIFNNKTKMIVLNNPHNPIGKVFNAQELETIANLCKKYDVLCLTDEVYEWLVYAPKKHIRMAALPGMWERTITVGSAGKTFSVTGWRTGWAYGATEIMRNLHIIHQNCVGTCCTPVQEALARSYELELARYNTPDCYFVSLAKELLAKRDFLVEVLRENGFNPTVPDGGYFMVADWTNLKVDIKTEQDKYKDVCFTKKLTKEAGVLAMPPSAFYSEEHKQFGEKFARFCFIKKTENLVLAEKLIKEWIAKAALPGMWERTITVGSAGKTFSVTGWRTGWAYGATEIMRNLHIIHQNCVGTCCTPVQEALARSYELELARYNTPDCYFVSLAKELLAKRDFLVEVLRENGFNPTVPDGGYFMVADWTNLKVDIKTEQDKYKDVCFTKKLTKEAGVLAMPPSAFYSEEHKQFGEKFARFCFIKKTENLVLAEKLIKEWIAKGRSRKRQL